MKELTYVDVPGAAAIQCKVRLGKKIVGAIYKSADGFYYRPTGGSVVGLTYSTIAEVKQTL